MYSHYSNIKIIQFLSYTSKGLLDDNRRSSNVEIFNFESKLVTQGKSMSKGLSSMAAAVLDDCIYVCGGYDGLRSVRLFQCYLPKLNTWIELAPLIQERYGAGAVCLNDRIYAIGGFSSSSCLNTCEKYDPTSNTWSFIKSMTVPRACAGVAVLDGKIYA